MAKRRTSSDRKSTRLNSSHHSISYSVFFFNDTATTEIYTLSLHDALPILFSAATQKTYVYAVKRLAKHYGKAPDQLRSEEHTSELQSPLNLVFRFFF